MKKIVFILGSIEALLGIILWSIADMLKNVMPIWGRVSFQSAPINGVGFSPDDYVMNTSITTTLAIVLIAVGVVQIFLSLIIKEK